MKKLFLLLTLGLLVLSSCKKDEEPEPEVVCYDCTYGSDTQEICEDDVSGGVNFEDYISAYQAAGYTCTKQ